MNARIDPSPLLPTLADIEAAAQVVYRDFAPTPQYRWALLSQRLGTDCWLKHENHTPVGAFKIRGGLTYFDQLAQRGALPQEVISATRGNHGQSMGWAAWQLGREERRHARAGRHAHRAWRGLSGSARARHAPSTAAWRTHGAQLSP